MLRRSEIRQLRETAALSLSGTLSLANFVRAHNPNFFKEACHRGWPAVRAKARN